MDRNKGTRSGRAEIDPYLYLILPSDLRDPFSTLQAPPQIRPQDRRIKKGACENS